MSERRNVTEQATLAGARLAVSDQQAGLSPRYQNRGGDDGRHPFVRGYLALTERDAYGNTVWS